MVGMDHLGFCDVAAGNNFSIALTHDGDVYRFVKKKHSRQNSKLYALYCREAHNFFVKYLAKDSLRQVTLPLCALRIHYKSIWPK